MFGVSRFAREALTRSLERVKYALVHPLAILVPPPLCDCVASSSFSRRFRRQWRSPSGLSTMAYFGISSRNLTKGCYP